MLYVYVWNINSNFNPFFLGVAERASERERQRELETERDDQETNFKKSRHVITFTVRVSKFNVTLKVLIQSHMFNYIVTVRVSKRICSLNSTIKVFVFMKFAPQAIGSLPGR